MYKVYLRRSIFISFLHNLEWFGGFHEYLYVHFVFFYLKTVFLVLDYYLVGDSAYPCKKYLLTPFLDGEFLYEKQVNYNKALQSCKLCVDETFTMLKQRFPQLYHCKLRDMEFLILFVKACCILYNLSDPEDFDIIDKGVLTEVKSYPENEFGKVDEDEEIGLALRDVICEEMLNNVKPATPKQKRLKKALTRQKSLFKSD